MQTIVVERIHNYYFKNTSLLICVKCTKCVADCVIDEAAQ